MPTRTLPLSTPMSGLVALGLFGCIDNKGTLELSEASADHTAFSAATSNLPAAFSAPAVTALDNTPSDNPLTDAGATLGRALFYDPRLSREGTVSCASCHQQDLAFADGMTLSEGVDGGLTRRHGMPLVNVRWYARSAMFWDERASTLEEQVLMPIQDEVEMDLDLATLEDVLEAEPIYDDLFIDAFGDAERSSDRVSLALAQFVRAMVSADAPYDVGLADQGGDPRPDFANFTVPENRGKSVFLGQAGCGDCHLSSAGRTRQASIFYIDEPTNNGLDRRTGADDGVGDITGRAQDQGLFKSPSLRNVAVTGPYMHDGRLETLTDVVEHYRRTVQPHPNLDPRLQRNGAQGISNQDAADLVAFLETLTDEAFLTSPLLADPWQ